MTAYSATSRPSFSFHKFKSVQMNIDCRPVVVKNEEALRRLRHGSFALLNRLRGGKAFLGSIFCEFQEQHSGQYPLCEGPMICAGLIAFVGRSLLHRMRPPRHSTDSFLDAAREPYACDCLPCRKVGRAQAPEEQSETVSATAA